MTFSCFSSPSSQAGGHLQDGLLHAFRQALGSPDFHHPVWETHGEEVGELRHGRGVEDNDGVDVFADRFLEVEGQHGAAD